MFPFSSGQYFIPQTGPYKPLSLFESKFDKCRSKPVFLFVFVECKNEVPVCLEELIQSSCVCAFFGFFFFFSPLAALPPKGQAGSHDLPAKDVGLIT